mgnify:CR=1 FL=1
MQRWNRSGNLAITEVVAQPFMKMVVLTIGMITVMWWRNLVIRAILTVFLLGGLQELSKAASTEHLTALQGTDYHLVHSKVVDHDYHVFVKVPETEKSEKLPVVYLLDGGNLFPMLTPYARYLNIFDEVPPVIMVGISYGTSDWRQGNMRSRDYTLPAKRREHYGGAEKFHQFLTQELIPMIEKKYPADPKQRILLGHSIGGQFALYCAMFQPQTFTGLIASNPAIHRNTDLFLKPLELSSHHPKLFIMQADKDDDQFKKPRQQWLDYWRDKPHHWQQQVMTAKDHNHMSSVPVAFRRGLMWLFQP